MTTPVNEIVDSLKVRAGGVANDHWPQLSASPANALWLTDSADPLNTSTNAALQITVMPNSVFLEALATDGVTSKQLQIGNAGGVSLVPNGGNVGIGTTAPTQALEVNGAVKATSFLLNNTPLVSSQWTSGAGDISFTGGKVGIGVPTPDLALDVGSRMRVRQGGDASAGIWFYQTTPATDCAFVGMAGDNQVGFYGNTGASWGLVMDTSSGAVGIGTGSTPLVRTLQTQGSEIHSGGPGGGFSFANRGTGSFVDLPPNGERWVWYALGGAARLWSNGDKLTVTPGGNVGIGVTAPSLKLQVEGTTGFGGPNYYSHFPWVDNIAYVTGTSISLRDGAPAGWAERMRIEPGHVWVRGTDIHLTGRGGGDGNNHGWGRALVDLGRSQGLIVNYANDFGKVQIGGPVFASIAGPSDARLKTNITPLTGVLDKLEHIRGVAFEWTGVEAALTGAAGTKAIGLIAQEVEAVFPELVLRWGEDDYRAIDYSRLTSVLIEAVKELKRENQALTRELDSVKTKLAL